MDQNLFLGSLPWSIDVCVLSLWQFHLLCVTVDLAQVFQTFLSFQNKLFCLILVLYISIQTLQSYCQVLKTNKQTNAAGNGFDCIDYIYEFKGEVLLISISMHEHGTFSHIFRPLVSQ